mmetsp:Transcript_40710/g.97667  ORF Transcript_40710/g.97667 Transcript_40710/m.97667 type:complete len:458 (-) Transcript_40710:39-1412(-)
MCEQLRDCGANPTAHFLYQFNMPGLAAEPVVPSSTVTSDTWLCMLFAVIGVSGAIFANGQWKKLGAAEGSSLSRDVDRSALLDNTKWFAQFLVIFNHFMFRNVSGVSLDTKTWLSGGEDFLYAMYSAEELVVNPLFCFVSGVVSQGAPSQRRLQRFAQYLVLPALMFVMVVRPLLWQFLITLDPTTLPTGFSTMIDQLSHLDTVTIPWYLEALIVWRASVYVIWAQLHPSVAFVGMIAVSCMAGYSTQLNLDHWGSGLGSATGYLPYFALGYVFPFGKVTQLVEKPSAPVSALIAVSIFCWAFWIVPSMFSEHALPDGHGTYDCCSTGAVFAKLSDLDRSLYWIRRLGRMTIDVVPTLLLVFMVLPRSETPLTYMGSHTLYSYLFHSAVHHWRDVITQSLPIPVFTSPIVHVAVLILHVPYCLGVLTALTSSYFRNLFRWALTPDWASIFFEEPIKK